MKLKNIFRLVASCVAFAAASVAHAGDCGDWVHDGYENIETWVVDEATGNAKITINKVSKWKYEYRACAPTLPPNEEDEVTEYECDEFEATGEVPASLVAKSLTKPVVQNQCFNLRTKTCSQLKAKVDEECKQPFDDLKEKSDDVKEICKADADYCKWVRNGLEDQVTYGLTKVSPPTRDQCLKGEAGVGLGLSCTLNANFAIRLGFASLQCANAVKSAKNGCLPDKRP
jgi:hypothetical protein